MSTVGSSSSNGGDGGDSIPPRKKKDKKEPKRGKSFCGCCQFAPYEPEEAYLYAFDFDHTIVDQNSDTAVMEVIHDPVPTNLTRLFDGTNWEEYMEGVFKFVAEEGGTYDIIAEKIRELQPTEGMPHLLHKIVMARRSLHHRSKLIIVSDANSFFIETFLSNLKPPVVPDTMITNQAEKTEEGFLKLTPYESQTDCPYCPKNLCKGSALMKYVEKKGPFEKIYYTGDGGNDICPALRLSKTDVVFVRKNFAMDKILKHGSWKGQVVDVKAKIIFWETAKEIEREMIF